ncbi:MAG: methylmalonyl-CoA mutase [Candidatus Latescibacterota bacterium]|nr:MAG: methylmalonyl-CoA mutase [Candidatus Latescibacterota bacterium]
MKEKAGDREAAGEKPRFDEWKARVYEPSRAKLPERKGDFRSPSGIPLAPVYTGLDRAEGLELPGVFPYTRAIQPTLYRSRLWTMRQYSGFGTAEETNRRFRFLLDQGQTGLSVAFDLPTQMGLDSDDTLADGEVGRVGVAIDTIHDMRTLLRGIPLDRVSVSMTINSTASILLAFYLALAEESGVPWEKLRGTVQNDILKEYAARGTYVFPPRPSLRLVTDMFAFCEERVPEWNPISVSGYHMREAGATAVQELAFTLGDGIAYLEAARAAGVDPGAIAGRVTFFFDVMSDLFEEVAKFRASRRLWARLCRDRFGIAEEKAKLKFHAQTGGSTLTAQQPMNNVARVTLQALAAVLGGAQSLHTNAWDEALALPSEGSARLALRTQQILACESGVANVVDPLGGSYYIESLTDRLEREAEALLARIDEEGGMLAAIEKGFVQREIQRSAYQHQKRVEAKEVEIVGVNRYATEEPIAIDTFTVDPALEREQKERLARIRAARPTAPHRAAIDEVGMAARSGANLMPPILEAVRAEATVGEISAALREVFGRHEEIVTI